MGHMERQQLASMTLDDLANWMAQIGAGSPNDQVAKAEFLRRQTQAQIDAAKAAEDTAVFTRHNARYMLWSVIVLAASSVCTLVVSIIN
jgi:hypothetical protein